MNYVLRTQLPKNKSVKLALMSIYGIGRSKSLFICKKLGFLSNFKVVDMSDYQWRSIIKSVDDLIRSFAIDLGPDLKILVKQNEKSLIDLGLYRGFRLKNGLPSRGQRTHSNAQTARRFVNKRQIRIRKQVQKKK